MSDKLAFLKRSGEYPEYEEITVPSLGTVRVRALSAGQKDRFDMAMVNNNKTDFRSSLIVACVMEESGLPTFDADDIPKLSDMPCFILEPIFELCLKVNRFSEEDREALRKNLNGQAVTS